MKTYVIAGTSQEANYWIINDLGKKYPSNTSLSMSNYVYVSSPDIIRGIRDPHGVFVGNWLGRPDILEIVQTLIYASTTPNSALAKIHTQVRQSTRVRPTPKIVSGYQANINEAGRLMAQAIDEEVLNNLAHKINGGTISQGKANVRG